MPYFQPLPPSPNFPEIEKTILDWWKRNDTVSKYLHLNDNSSKTFSFIDGPITANNPMGVHHARGRTLKDIFQRFKNAQGFAQRFQNGFDCQGLWVEVEVEKEAGFNSKKDIQNFGLDKFTQACVARVNKYAAIQTDQSKRLGMFMDWENSYYTMSETNNLYIWHFLKKINQNGWLEKRQSAITWCPRCETGLSQHEQADGYKQITDTSIYLKFKLKNRHNEHVLAWTTTPWTLSANVLLAINTDFEYVQAKIENQLVYLAKQSAERLGISEYNLIDPTKLLNLEYEPLYQFPIQKNVRHYLVDWKEVNPTEGSGIVHIAPGCGQEDFDLGKKIGADMIAPLDERGYFLDGYGDLSGKYAHDVANLVIDYLKKIGAFYKSEPISHRYPHCWRCKTKCLFRLQDSWYIKSDKIRPKLKEAAQKVHWHPKYVGRRMQNWLDNMEDWLISRKRFYGLALPFYECPCGKLTVVGSKRELESLAVNPEKVKQLPSLHRPWIDKITIKCPKCGATVSRISDVGDCWLDAGVVPFSTLKYLEDKTYWQKWFPADLVLEMIEQVRLWFYSMLFFSVTLENTTPYKNVVAHSEVRDENGERMSKTKKNGIPYDQAVELMGADAMRWLYCRQKSYTSVNFGYHIADQVKRDFLLILWNSYRFFIEHSPSENIPNSPPDQIPKSTHILDQWIISRLHSTIDKVTKYLERFNTSLATLYLEKFVSDLSTWYIRRSRDRFDNRPIFNYCFHQLFRMIAPFVPFLSDYLFLNLTQTDSIHLQPWPKAYPDLVDKNLEESMEVVRTICQLAHAQRQKSSIKVRQPLASAAISCPAKLSNDLLSLIKDEINVKKLSVKKSTETSVSLDVNLDQDLIEEGEYREILRSIQILRKQNQLALTDKIKIFAPSWPKKFQTDLLKKTVAVSIELSSQLNIEKV